MSRETSPGLLRRLAALVYDTLLVVPLVMLSVALAMALQLLLDRVTGGAAEVAPLAAWLVRLLAATSVVAFYCGFWRIRGQTLGMQAWRIRLRPIAGEPGQRVSLRQALLRCAAALLSLLPLGAGYWWCLFDKHGRYWHDYLSGTELELLPPRRH